ncbi:LuxR family transcriptional regulator [Novosphingobium sp. AAP1]|uniref:helix-turn-helix domain-containing protein n=1 Tax=unclassified Novosphingobium TaxID=2644732 RepID=UPI0003B69923|nr:MULTISPECIES: DUF4019 domain-containing protein [unclassified Novosphingobium]KPF54685.1 LuxR family transcriptional regulator [Novosphingobium sp. AAP1]
MTTPITHAVDSLTEKERQVLRLMVRGHDAKSIACRLNLSVHTINERLRDARRKLAVSSSREAARLLFDAEGEPPKNSGDSELGEAPHPGDMEQPGLAERISRRGWIKTGSIAMSLLMGLAALVALPLMNASSDPQPAATVETSDPAIIATARRFLELADQHDWAQTYRMTTLRFRKANTQQVWANVSEKVHADLGMAQSRQLLSEQNLPAPPNGYEVVKFRSHFAKKGEVVETVTLEHVDGAWQVAGVTVG